MRILNIGAVLVLGVLVARAVDPEGPLAAGYDLVRNPAFLEVDSADPDKPADVTLRRVDFEHVKDAEGAFAGDTYLAVKEPGGTVWFRLKEQKTGAVPAQVLCSVRARGTGTLRIMTPFRGGRKSLGRNISDTLEVNSSAWEPFTFLSQVPEELYAETTRVGLAIKLSGAIDLDAVHVIDVNAMQATAAASFLPEKLVPRLTCPRATRAPTIDGRIDAEEWREATAVTGFSDTSYSLSPVQTVVHMTRDDTHLYFAFRSTIEKRGRTEAEIAGEPVHDLRFGNQQDFVEIHLRTPADDRYQFVVNPAGGILDLKNRDRAWQSDARAAGVLRDAGESVGGVLTFAKLVWEGELAVSFASFGTDAPVDGTIWDVNFCRDLGVVTGSRRQSTDWTTWVKNASFINADLGELQFLADAPAVRIDSIGELAGGQLAAEGTLVSRGDADVAVEVAAFRAGETANALGRAVDEIAIVANRPQAFRVAEHVTDVPQMKATYAAAVQDKASGRLLTLLAVPFEFQSPIDFAAHYNGADKALRVVADLTAFPRRSEARHLAVAVSAEGDTATLVSREIPLDGRVYLEEPLDVAALAAGRYVARGALVDGAGRELIGGSSVFTAYPAQAWRDDIIPLTDAVPPPFTPLTVNGNSVRVVLRDYTLGANGLPASVNALGESILTAPAALTGTIDGAPARWQFRDLALESHNGGAATWRFYGEAGGATVAGTVRTEYDGFTRWQATVAADADVSIDALALEFTLRSEDALYFRAENAVSSKRFGVALYAERVSDPVDTASFLFNTGAWIHTNEFLHTAWLGGDKRGLALMTETDQYLRGPRRVEVIRQGDGVTLRYNLVSRPVQLDQPLVYDFAWNATPFKPLPADPRRYTSVMASRNLYEHPDAAQRAFVRMMHQTSPNCYYDIRPTTQRILEEGHAFGVKIVPYFSFGVGAEGTPEFDLLAEEIKLKPEFGGTAGTRGAWRGTCSRSRLWRDYVTFKVRRLCGEHGLDGLYLDVSRAAACNNPAHGCGYFDPVTDRRVPTVNVFGLREIYKRTYAYMKTLDPERVVFLHGADMAALPFVDVFSQGESWNAEREKGYEDLTPDFYRTIVMRTQYGVPFTFYAYHQYTWRGGKYHTPTPPRDVIMMGMQHRNHFNASDQVGVPPSGAIWKFTEPFWATSEFFPYWDAANPAAADRPGLFCATYRQREQSKAWIFVSNWNADATDGTVTLDRARLGFKPGAMRLADPLADEAADIPIADRIPVTVPGRDFRVIVVE